MYLGCEETTEHTLRIVSAQVENWCPRLPWRTKTLGEDTDRRGQVRDGSPRLTLFTNRRRWVQ